VLPGYAEPEYLYYVTLDPERDTVAWVLREDAVIERISWSEGQDGTVLFEVDQAGDYALVVEGAGTVIVSVVPQGLRETGSFSGRFPPGWLAFGLDRGAWGGHSQLDIGYGALRPVETFLFVLHDELVFEERRDMATSGKFVVTPSAVVTWYFLVILNGNPDPVEGTVYADAFGDPGVSTGSIVSAVLFAVVVAVAGTVIAITLRTRGRAIPPRPPLNGPRP
jgi:hypothetical protein